MRRVLPSLILFLLAAASLRAQGSGRTNIYPSEIYPGENVVTITNDAGIDKVRFRASSATHVEVPAISGCPKSVNIRVRIDDPTTAEQVDVTVYDCNGLFTTRTLHGQNWTIRPEFTGRVEVGRDTCLQCEIITTAERLVDSIVIFNPEFRVLTPSGPRPWTASGEQFKYKVCYRPTRVENIREMIRIYIRRDEPNGGLTQYVIEKPVTAVGVPPPAPKPPRPPAPEDTLPPLVDPTTFRNIVMPTAETLGKGDVFAGNYDIAGWIGGYGISDRVTVLIGTVTVPDFISRLLVVTVGAKYGVIDAGPLKAAIGFQYGYSSSVESDISTAAPYAVVSYGDRQRRLSLGAGYAWKHHSTPGSSFDRNAAIVALGGDVTIARGMKIAAESYFVESSGLVPLAVTMRWFGQHYAFDAGLGVDLENLISIKGTGSLSGEITNFRVAPILSFLWRW